MSRADDLQAAHKTIEEMGGMANRAYGYESHPVAVEHAAIPDLLAVVRAAQAVVVTTVVAETRTYDALVDALAVFEAGGKERE